MKNDRCQFIGRSYAATIEDCNVDWDALFQSWVPKDLIFVKDFASDKKEESLFSLKALINFQEGLIAGISIVKSCDISAFLATLFFLSLYLRAVNRLDVLENREYCT